MGRHADGAERSSRRPLLLSLTGLAAVAVAALVAVDVLAPGLVPVMASLPRPWVQPTTACVPTGVAIVAAPEVVPALTGVLAPLENRRLADGHCLHTEVTAQAPDDTVAATRALPVSRAPQLWVPDSSTRLGGVSRWPVDPVTSFASSPVVLAGGTAALAARGWTTTPPTWAAALTTKPLAALPDPRQSAAGLAALAALTQRLGNDAVGQRALAAAVLAASRQASSTLDQARAAALDNEAAGPVVVTSEVAMVDANRTQGSGVLSAVYPEAVAPTLDYPLVQVARARYSPAQAVAVSSVLAALTAPQAQASVHAAGLRDPKGTIAPQADGVSSPALTQLPVLTSAQTEAFLLRLQSLSLPSRLLTVIDVSLSMRAPVPGTQLTRIELAGQAAAGAGNLLAGDSSAGLWVFALDLPGGKPWRELAPIRELDAAEGGDTHRRALISTMNQLSGELSGGGTALYATTLAAVRRVRATYDPRAVNAVVLFTDGTNENEPSLSLSALVKQLRADAAAEPDKPVELIAIGLGPSADMAALRAMAQANGGEAYRAQTPQALQTVLFDAISRRPAPAT